MKRAAPSQLRRQFHDVQRAGRGLDPRSLELPQGQQIRHRGESDDGADSRLDRGEMQGQETAPGGAVGHNPVGIRDALPDQVDQHGGGFLQEVGEEVLTLLQAIAPPGEAEGFLRISDHLRGRDCPERPQGSRAEPGSNTLWRTFPPAPNASPPPKTRIVGAGRSPASPSRAKRTPEGDSKVLIRPGFSTSPRVCPGRGARTAKARETIAMILT